MRIGTNYNAPHTSAEEWALKMKELGAEAIAFPTDYTAPVEKIDAYVRAAEAADLLIAEVGVWNSPFHPDPEVAAKAYTRLKGQLELADYIRARCCVNVSGAVGDVWFALYRDNFSQSHYDELIRLVQKLLDEVKPQNTFFTLESMQWMPPDSPEQYAQIIRDVNRPGFAAHMDMCNFIKDPYLYTHQDELLNRCMKELAPYVRSCHFKDCAMEPGLTVAIHEVPAGTGEMILQDYVRALNTLDPDMPLLSEHLKTQEQYVAAMNLAKQLRSNL